MFFIHFRFTNKLLAIRKLCNLKVVIAIASLDLPLSISTDDMKSQNTRLSDQTPANVRVSLRLATGGRGGTGEEDRPEAAAHRGGQTETGRGAGRTAGEEDRLRARQKVRRISGELQTC